MQPGLAAPQYKTPGSSIWIGVLEQRQGFKTRNPGGLRAEHRFAALVGWTLLAAGLTTLPLWLVALGFYR